MDEGRDDKSEEREDLGESFHGFLISKCARQMTRRQGDTESTIFDFNLHLLMNHHDVLREGSDGGSHLLCKRFH